MKDHLDGPFSGFRYTLVDLREMDGTPLLASAETSDTVLSILTRLSDQRQNVEQIVRRVAAEPDAERRKFYLESLLILAGLRDLEEQVKEEVEKMPVFIDTLENKVLGREYMRGERHLLRQMLEKRFGALPEWASQGLEKMREPMLSDLGLRLLDAKSLEELMGE